jgi:hypothetical protein
MANQLCQTTDQLTYIVAESQLEFNAQLPFYCSHENVTSAITLHLLWSIICLYGMSLGDSQVPVKVVFKQRKPTIR